MSRTVLGYRSSPAAERAGFEILVSFALAIGGARAVNYVRERRRPAPRLRSWARQAYHAPGQERLRIHHFIPGVGLAFVAGTAAILTRDDRREYLFSLPFGTGVGLTCDEIGILIDLDNPYWGREKLAAGQMIAAGLGAMGLAANFYRNARQRDVRRYSFSNTSR